MKITDLWIQCGTLAYEIEWNGIEFQGAVYKTKNYLQFKHKNGDDLVHKGLRFLVWHCIAFLCHFVLFLFV